MKHALKDARSSAILLALCATAIIGQRRETGFLSRPVTVRGTEFRYQVYLPREFDRRRSWPSVIYAALGEKEKTLEYLSQAWEVRAVQLIWLAVDPSFDSLRDEPVFLDVFQKMKIPASSSKVGDSMSL